MIGYLELRRESPVRPPDWRWKLAEFAVRDQEPVERRLRDEWVMCAYRIQRAKKEVEAQGDKKKSESRWLRQVFDGEGERGLAALTAYSISRQNRKSTGNEIESRLLARQTVEEIAELVGVTPDVIEAYEACFFNVLDRIDRKSWVVNCVLGSDFHDGLLARDWPKLWQLAAYFGGPVWLEYLMHKNDITRVTDKVQLKYSIGADMQNSIGMKGWLVSRTASINTLTEVPLLEAVMKNTELQHKLSLGQADENAAALEGVLRSFVYQILDGRTAAPIKAEARTVGLLKAADGSTLVDEAIDDWSDDPFRRVPTEVQDSGPRDVGGQ